VPLTNTSPDATVSEVLAGILLDFGVTLAFGVMGGTVAVLCETLAREGLKMVHCRHEAGAAFAATEASLATGKAAAVFTTSGPSLVNAMNGLMAARWEGAKVILLSGTTPASQRSRWAFQETSSFTMPEDFFRPGPLFHYAVDLRDGVELASVASRLRFGLARPGGFVAHVGVPSVLQSSATPALSLPPCAPPSLLAVSDTTASLWARELSSAPFVIWVGFGARNESDAVRAFAERTGAPVMCSPRGRGIFPEDHPQFLGVTGLAGPNDPAELVSAARAERVLVLGSRLGEFTSLWDARLIPPKGIVHVDVDADVFGAAFPSAPTHAVQADVGEFLRAVSARLPHTFARRAFATRGIPLPPIAVRGRGPVRPKALMAAVQRIVVEKSNAPILVDCGNSYAWANHQLRFRSPGRFRASVGWGSMGHAAAGVLGTALATGKKSVAIVGDGAMLMQNELSTAVAYRIPAVFIVLNDAQYGMIEQGMRRGHLEPVETQIPRVDFVALARSVGADGIAVRNESDLDAALEQAMSSDGPFVVDVDIDRGELAPIAKRIYSLEAQGVGRTEHTNE